MKAIIKRIIAFFIAIAAAITGFFHGPAKPENDLVVELASNPSTGYSWEITFDKDGIVELESHDYKSDVEDKMIVGAGGTDIFRFKAIGEGKVTITFEYCRTWEPDSTVRTVVYGCVAKDGKITVTDIKSIDS